jgi:hypothetical protein
VHNVSLKSDTQTVRLDVNAEVAFAFISNPQTLPQWAVGFCRGIRPDGRGWIVRTASGECGLEVDADPRRRTVDFHMRPAPGIEARAYSRLIECDGGCEYVFTQFGPASVPEDAFQANVESLREELAVLRSVLRARHACRA